jgi:hypothetical protein
MPNKPAGQPIEKHIDRVMRDLARPDDERAGFAYTMFDALAQQVKAFEAQLKDGEETAVWLAQFGSNTPLVVTKMTYRHPHLIILVGEDSQGHRRELVQHVSQVSLLLEAVPSKQGTRGRRIGFGAVGDK